MTPSEICNNLVTLQRDRVFYIKQQSRADRSVESYIARLLGFHTGLPENQRKKIFAAAAAIRTAGESGEGLGEIVLEDQCKRVLAACRPLIEASSIGRAQWDELRSATEKTMRSLARQLPIWPWAETIRGLSDLGVGVIVGEAGYDLSEFRDHGCLWKRLGLAVIQGKRQGAPGAGATAADWIAHGYNPRRRAQIWAFTDNLIVRQQWRGARDEDGIDPEKSGKPVAVPAHAIGPYGEIYGRRKQYESAQNEAGTYAELAAAQMVKYAKEPKAYETLASGRLLSRHLNRRAVRYTAKKLIRDIYVVWRRCRNELPELAITGLPRFTGPDTHRQLRQ